MADDDRIIPATVAYGARCRWWDDKRNAATRPSGLPCCPGCGSPLYEADGPEWLAAAVDYEAKHGSIGYVESLWQTQGTCNVAAGAARG